MTKARLDKAMVAQGLVPTRSQAESYIKLAKVLVNGQSITKPGFLVSLTDVLKLTTQDSYVSRAAFKLASVAAILKLDFHNKVVLDIGSSTGGFTDYSLQHGAIKVIAVEVGTQQLHPSLRNNPHIELHERTDIRDIKVLPTLPDITLIDVSFISLRDILPHLLTVINQKTLVVAMVKPQFEAQQSSLKHKGVVKNDTMRRNILKNFEAWVQYAWAIKDKADSHVMGAKGNQERFYVLKKL
jgi:23S rRNA (cytidine1920-2'-O)/16S rRNA (cytidine1409-2'-O)-methyltransferase